MGILEYDNRLKCRKCGELKPRSQFKPRHGVTLRYDYLCAQCRRQGIKELQAYELKKRVDTGLMTQEQYEREKKRRHSIRAVVGAENLAMRYAGHWERPRRSAKMAIKLLKAYPFDTPEKAAWADRVRYLVDEALEQIEQQRHRKLPEDKLLFWYDVVDGVKLKLRQAIEDYPDGPDKSPLQVM